MEAQSSRRAVGLVGLVVVVTALEALAYLKGGVFGWAAARLWAAMGLGFVVLGIREIAGSVAAAVRERSLVSAAMLLIVSVAALWGIGGVDHLQIQHEGTQQVAWGLEGFQEPDWRYTEYGFLGYPLRQYLIVAAPSLAVGRGLVAVRLGFAIVFLFGALLFWSGARAAWADRPRGTALAALAAVSVVAFPYAVKHLHWYEQTTLPLAFTLAAAGWLLITVRSPSLVNWLGLAWIGALLGTSYTPGLGSWSLLLAALGWLAWRAWKVGDRGGAAVRLAVAVMVAGFGGLSFLTRVDLIKEAGRTMRPEPLGAVVEALSIFFLGTPEAFIPAVLVLPILIPLGLGLIGRLGLPALVASWWVIGIVVASIGLAGYAVHRVDFEVHRAQVVIPVLLLLTGCAVLRLRALGSSSTTARVAFVLICVLVLGQAVSTVTASYRTFRPTLRDSAFAELFGRPGAHGASPDDHLVLMLLTDRHEFGNAGDYLRYFHPRHAVVRSVEEAESVAAETTVVMLVADSGRTDLPLWIEPGDLTRFTRDDPYDPHSIVVWAGPPPAPGPSR